MTAFDESGGAARRAAASDVASLFFGQARLHPQRIAVEDAQRRLTYSELAGRVRRLSVELAELEKRRT